MKRPRLLLQEGHHLTGTYVAHYNRGIAFEMELVKRMLDRQISLILQYVKKCLYFEEIEKRALRKLKHTK